VGTLASDVALELERSDIIVGELDSLLNTKEQSEGINDSINVNENTLKEKTIIKPDNLQSIPIPEVVVVEPLRNLNAVRIPEEREETNFLLLANTQSIFNQIVGDETPSFRNFYQRFILCDVPNPYSYDYERWAWFVLQFVFVGGVIGAIITHYTRIIVIE
jgi:hypothetical protein